MPTDFQVCHACFCEKVQVQWPKLEIGRNEARIPAEGLKLTPTLVFLNEFGQATSIHNRNDGENVFPLLKWFNRERKNRIHASSMLASERRKRRSCLSQRVSWDSQHVLENEGA